MKVSNETKVGALTIIAITLIILGFNFLRGKTIFKSGNFIYAKYADTKGLIISNPVFVNGFQVGTVFDIENQTADLSQIVVSIKLNNTYKIPANSVATIQDNPLGTNSIAIVLGDAKSYLNSEDTIKTAPAASLLGDLMNTLSPLGEQTKKTISDLEKVLVNINKVLDDQNKANFAQILSNLSFATESLNKSLVSVESMLQSQSGSIAQTANNVNSFTKNLSDNNKKINDIINNLDTTTRQLKNADLSKTVKEIQVVVQELTQTLHNLNNGDGSAAKLLNDPEIYKLLQGTIKSINTLVDDVKTHPKRYVNISVFGKKDKTTPLLKPIADTTTNE
jgi:phospholipid/cholesterol/gamma-HCH transport system substrate-binding protein